MNAMAAAVLAVPLRGSGYLLRGVTTMLSAFTLGDQVVEEDVLALPDALQRGIGRGLLLLRERLVIEGCVDQTSPVPVLGHSATPRP